MSTAPTPDPAAGMPQLDHDRLDAYEVALEFQSLSVDLVPRRGLAELRDQLDHASTSIVLNIAQGAGRRFTFRARPSGRPPADGSGWPTGLLKDEVWNGDGYFHGAEHYPNIPARHGQPRNSRSARGHSRLAAAERENCAIAPAWTKDKE